MANPILTDKHFQDETAAFAHVEARLWPNGPVCPHCAAAGDKIGALKGKTARPGLRKCYACRREFTVRIGTIFEDSHLPLHLWLQIIHLMCASKKGISTRQIQRLLNCSMKTAWFLTHRIREVMAPAKNAGPLGGEGVILEVDETYIGPEAGMKKGRPPAKKQVVFALVERGGKARSIHLPGAHHPVVRAALARNASLKSRLMSDENKAYKLVGWNFASHDTVNHEREEYARGEVSTNTIEGMFSILKRGLYGTYQRVSEDHLQRYLCEFDFRYSNREKLGVNDVSRAAIALKQAKGKRLTYRTTGAKQ
jgi:transposase-like protein